MGQKDEPSTAMGRLSELELRLRELEEKRNLVTKTLYMGVFFAILVWISLTGKIALVLLGDEFIRSTQYSVILGILVIGLLIYFAFVLGRFIKLSGEVSKTKKSLALAAGSKDRKP